jgi:pseudo-rSAM protein
VVVLAGPPFSPRPIARVHQDLAASAIPHQVKFLIRTSRQAARASRVIDSLGLPEVVKAPYFDGRNLAFFRQAVFTNERRLFGQRLDMNELYERHTRNPLAFGALDILPDGGIRANAHGAILGRAGIGGLECLSRAVRKELRQGHTWLGSRALLAPCALCLYQGLCPPVTGYEQALGRHDLCRGLREHEESAAVLGP